MIRLSIDPALAHEVTVAAAWFESVSSGQENPHWPEMEALAARLRTAHQGKQPSEIAGLAHARSLYRRFGVDPTRHRPSSEALLRRVLKGQALYQINRLVDAINWASLNILLPIGLYDLDQVEGDLVLRRGLEGESYEGIRRGVIHVDSRLVVADNRGACGSPTADSLRTSITGNTSRAVAILFAEAAFPRNDLDRGLADLIATVLSWCGGTLAGRCVLGPDS